MTQFSETLAHKHAKNVSPNDTEILQELGIHTLVIIYIYSMCVCVRVTSEPKRVRVKD